MLNIRHKKGKPYYGAPDISLRVVPNKMHKINHGNYEYLVELIKFSDQSTCIRFHTRYEDSKNPNGLQMKFQMVLSEEEIENLIKILQNQK